MKKTQNNSGTELMDFDAMQEMEQTLWEAVVDHINHNPDLDKHEKEVLKEMKGAIQFFGCFLELLKHGELKGGPPSKTEQIEVATK